MKRFLFSLCSFCLLLAFNAAADDKATALANAVKSGPMSKMGVTLAHLYYQHYDMQTVLPEKAPAADAMMQQLIKVTDGYVIIDAVAASDSKTLYADLEALGMRKMSVFGSRVSGQIPIAALGQAASLDSLRFARPFAAMTNIGLVTSQGDITLNSDDLRDKEDVDGSGVTVGVLSDSFDCLDGAATDVATGDLPIGIVVLKDETGCGSGTDEGRAMMQLIRDVAPGATQAFHTAFDGFADFANGIIRLQQEANADVIVDDVIVLAEAMFQDDLIAQAADQVKADGSAYFSSAGNNARDSFEDPFRNSGLPGLFGGFQHDFDSGPGVDTFQLVTLPANSLTFFSFQWDEPFFSISGAPGSASDLDFIAYDLTGFPLLFSFGNVFQIQGIDSNIGGDAVEVILLVNLDPTPVQVQLALEKFDGPDPNLVKYVFFGNMTVKEFNTASATTYGHANAAGAEAVGAAAWFDASPFSEIRGSICVPACINSFSSAGGVPILFDLNGNRIFEIRLKPEVVGPDGGDTTFFGADLPFSVRGSDEPNGFPNFFGTSAAAPHVAGVAALILEEEDELTPDQIYQALETSARDMDDPNTPGFDTGFDFRTGFGLVDAVEAFEAGVRDVPKGNKKGKKKKKRKDKKGKDKKGKDKKGKDKSE